MTMQVEEGVRGVGWCTREMNTSIGKAGGGERGERTESKLPIKQQGTNHYQLALRLEISGAPRWMIGS
jgi:hypothetical protein